MNPLFHPSWLDRDDQYEDRIWACDENESYFQPMMSHKSQRCPSPWDHFFGRPVAKQSACCRCECQKQRACPNEDPEACPFCPWEPPCQCHRCKAETAWRWEDSRPCGDPCQCEQPRKKHRSQDCRCERCMAMASPYAGALCIRKIDAENPATRLAGGTFDLLNQDKMVINTGTTNAQGELIFFRLPYGTYYVRETTAPTGYQLNPNTILVKINTCEPQVFLEVESMVIVGTVLITAVDAANPTIPLSEAGVLLMDSKHNTAASGTTGKDGTAFFQGIPVGTYRIASINPPAGHGPPTAMVYADITVAMPAVMATLPFPRLPA